jgi:hypothetical protein
MKNINEQLEEIIKEVMQEGFEVAMGGTPFKTEEENKADLEKLYDECVAKRTEQLSTLIQKEREEAFIAGEQNYQDRLKLDAEKIKESAVKDYMVWRHDRKLHPYELDALYREYLSQTKEDEGYASVKDWQESEGKYD